MQVQNLLQILQNCLLDKLCRGLTDIGSPIVCDQQTHLLEMSGLPSGNGCHMLAYTFVLVFEVIAPFLRCVPYQTQSGTE